MTVNDRCLHGLLSFIVSDRTLTRRARSVPNCATDSDTETPAARNLPARAGTYILACDKPARSITGHRFGTKATPSPAALVSGAIVGRPATVQQRSVLDAIEAAAVVRHS